MKVLASNMFSLMIAITHCIHNQVNNTLCQNHEMNRLREHLQKERNEKYIPYGGWDNLLSLDAGCGGWSCLN